MKFGGQQEHVLREFFSYRAISDLHLGLNGGHFSKWPTDIIQYLACRPVFKRVLGGFLAFT